MTTQPDDAPEERYGRRFSVADLVLGRRLANREFKERRIGAFEGLPAMGLDGLGSSAYGPEAALTVLIPLGAASLHYIGWVTAPTVALLAILFVSYRQTIAAYPGNGGAYIVARENLGPDASLVAAAALMIDYALNVAVGISAGVAALVSAAPALHPFILELCLAVLGLVTVANLRGTLDAGRAFALPTYLFVASFALIIGLGLVRAAMSGGSPAPVIAPPALGPASEAVTLWLLLRAFASGCTAMTGVEAVSNGMSAFKEPAVKYGRRTLTLICFLLGLLLVGVAYLASVFHVGAMDQTKDGYQSVLSQLAQAVVGRGMFYHVAMGAWRDQGPPGRTAGGCGLFAAGGRTAAWVPDRGLAGWGTAAGSGASRSRTLAGPLGALPGLSDPAVPRHAAGQRGDVRPARDGADQRRRSAGRRDRSGYRRAPRPAF